MILNGKRQIVVFQLKADECMKERRLNSTNRRSIKEPVVEAESEWGELNGKY